MPNQLNYPDPVGTTNQRPARISKVDLNLIRNSEKQILFGTNARDKVELWVYNADGSFAGHMILGPYDTSLTLTTIVDTDGPHELLNIDMGDVANRIGLEPGRYSFVGNFFRDEVGSELGYKLYISEISNDRTELKLQPVVATPETIADIYEFIVPSVPREFAQALIAEMLGQSLPVATEPTSVQIAEFANPDLVKAQLDVVISDTSSRISYSTSESQYESLVYTILLRAYNQALNLMAADVTNLAVQKIEILNYISNALDYVIQDMIAKREVEPHFILI